MKVLVQQQKRVSSATITINLNPNRSASSERQLARVIESLTSQRGADVASQGKNYWKVHLQMDPVRATELFLEIVRQVDELCNGHSPLLSADLMVRY